MFELIQMYFGKPRFSAQFMHTHCSFCICTLDPTDETTMPFLVSLVQEMCEKPQCHCARGNSIAGAGGRGADESEDAIIARSLFRPFIATNHCEVAFKPTILRPAASTTDRRDFALQGLVRDENRISYRLRSVSREGFSSSSFPCRIN